MIVLSTLKGNHLIRLLNCCIVRVIKLSPAHPMLAGSSQKIHLAKRCRREAVMKVKAKYAILHKK